MTKDITVYAYPQCAVGLERIRIAIKYKILKKLNNFCKNKLLLSFQKQIKM
jgi:hypothetical protein